MTTTVVLVLLALAGGFGVNVVSGMLSQEAQTRLARLPVTLARVARLLVPEDQREQWYRELIAELSYIAKETDGLPVTRLVKGLAFASGATRGAFAIRRSDRASYPAPTARSLPGRWQMWAGQYTGIAIIIAISLGAAQGFALIPDRFAWLLGLLPVTIGIQDLAASVRRPRSGSSPAILVTGLARVTVVSIACGADGITVYPLVFRGSSASTTLVILAVFATLIALSCLARAWLASHDKVAAVVAKRGPQVASAGLIMFGAYACYKTGTHPNKAASGMVAGPVLAVGVAAALFAATSLDSIGILWLLSTAPYSRRRR